MAFEAHIREVSHEGGMLAPFTGDAPKLGQVMQLPGGKWVGKVDTVIGEVSAAVVHITPFRDIETQLLIGQPVEIAPPKERQNDRRERRDDRSGSGIPMKEGDWTCPKCQNHNFAWRDNCNRCEAPKAGGGGGGHQRRDNRGGDRRDNRGGDRRGGGGGFQNRDNRGGERRDNRGGDRREGGQGDNNDRPPRREYKGGNDRRTPNRGGRKPGGWGPKDKRGPRRR